MNAPRTSSGSPASPAVKERQRMPYACEACRASKAKCEPSHHTEGICRRCFASKRECIYKTGPRKRRRRSKSHPAATRSTPPPCAPSKTFTIDVPMQEADDGSSLTGGGGGGGSSNIFDTLKEFHEGVMEALVYPSSSSPSSDGEKDTVAIEGTFSPGAASSKSAFTATTAISSSSRSTTTTHSFSSIQPQFNLDSATVLLKTFLEDMLPYFPVVAVARGRPARDATTTTATALEDASYYSSVPSLAKERPFVLLAILAAASSVRSLQGHSLYDEEFRKVLGLKFVSGGERSLELLVGLLIYCAWYPFHLRPKNKQAQQYMRMAGDIVRDLELDEPPPSQPDAAQLREQMPGIRAYLSCYYLTSVFASTFQRKQTVKHQPWTETCCRTLLEHSAGPEADEADRTLVWLVRLGHIVEETTSVHLGPSKHGPPQHVQLMQKGLEAQLREWQGQMNNLAGPRVAAAPTSPVLRMASWATEILLYGQPLLKFPSRSNGKARPPTDDVVVVVASHHHLAAPERLMQCVGVLRPWFDYVLTLPASGFVCFTAIQWSYLVITIILGLRLSFPLPHDCPSWDHAAARRALDMGTFFEKFARLGGSSSSSSNNNETNQTAPDEKRSSSGSTDVLSASKVVVGIVQNRYDRRLAALEKSTAAAAAAAAAAATETSATLFSSPHGAAYHRMATMAFDEGGGSSCSSGGVSIPSTVGTLGRNCPMFDGSMDGYLETWDDTFVNTMDFSSLITPVYHGYTDGGGGGGGGDGHVAEGTTAKPTVHQSGFYDLWATMTMGWGQHNVDGP